jgi:hypothetical protein
MYELGKF